MNVVVEWRELDDGDDGWQADCALYAYCTVGGSDILYIGKADGTTVRRRWNRSGKEGFWDALEREQGIYHHAVFLGEIALAPAAGSRANSWLTSRACSSSGCGPGETFGARNRGSRGRGFVCSARASGPRQEPNSETSSTYSGTPD